MDADALERDPDDQLDRTKRALLGYARKLARDPHGCRRQDVEGLRNAGATDEQIHAAVQVAAYFCYINRIASGLGVELEPEHRDEAPDVDARRSSDE